MIREIVNKFSNNGTRNPFDNPYNDGIPERRDVYERCKEHPMGDPEDHAHHDAYWTGAEGVFYCRTCEDWFRTWRDRR